MGYFIQLGGVVTAYRLTIDPGLFWGFDAPLWEVSLSFLGVIALFYAALQLLERSKREGAVVVLESAIWSFGGVYASLMLARFIDYLGAPYNNAIHAFVGLFAVGNKKNGPCGSKPTENKSPTYSNSKQLNC